METGAMINNGEHDAERQEKDHRQRKPVWRNIVENFTATWFTLAMNTGILSLLYHNQPWQFKGLYIISTIMYVFTIVLFVIFSTIAIIRWTVFHKTAVAKTQGNINEVAMLGAPPIAWLVITGLTALIVSNCYWGGRPFTILAIAMWWFGTLWMLIACIGVLINLFHHDVVHDRSMSTTLLLPAVGVATDAVIGALICRYAFDMTAHLAVPILIVCYMLDGLAIFMSLEIYTIYMHRLMAIGWPEPGLLPGLVFLVGPFAQTAAALLLAGSAASSSGYFADYDQGTFLTKTSGASVASASTLIAFLLLGHDFFWIVVACGGIAIGAMKRTLTYNLVWWSTLFPLATLTTAFVALSISLDSPAFRGLAAFLTIFLTINYFINWAFTIYYSITGDLLVKSEDDSAGAEKAD